MAIYERSAEFMMHRYTEKDHLLWDWG